MDQESKKKSKQAKLRTVTCEHCGKDLTVNMPAKPGRYKFTCPNCENKVSFVVEGEQKVLKSDILDNSVISHNLPKELKQDKAQHTPASVQRRPSPAAAKKAAGIPVLGIPKPHPEKENQYYVSEKALVNRQYRMECPECGKTITIMPRVPGKTIMVTCSVCGTQVRYNSVGEEAAQKAQLTPAQMQAQMQAQKRKQLIAQKQAQLQAQQQAQLQAQQQAQKQAQQQAQPASLLEDGPSTVILNSGPYHQKGPSGGPQIVPPPPTPIRRNNITHTDPKGMLCWKSGAIMRRSKSYRLMRGRNTVGRYDPEKPSVVMISGDDEMSRQSVEINVIPKQGINDYLYELRVLRATNTVFVNGRPVGYGLTVQLNYGDTLCMGRTIISFIKAPEDRR